MKKAFLVVAALLLLFGLVACGGDGAEERVPTAASSPTITAPTQTLTPGPTRTPTGASRAAPSDRISFFSDRDGIGWGIYFMNADGSGQARVIWAAGRLDPPGYSWSPDGSKIAYECGKICVAKFDGSGVVTLTRDTDTDYDFAPDWSPDGSNIAFVGDGFYHVINADGSGLRRLSLTKVSTGRDYPSWSPDSSKIAIKSGGDIHVINADGSGEKYIFNGQWLVDYFAWSPNSSKIVFSWSYGGSRIISVMNADGSGLTRLTPRWQPGDPASSFPHVDYPVWSPDGSKIAFFSCSLAVCDTALGRGNSDIYVMNADGSGLTNVTNHPAEDAWPSWSPDGSKIAFASNRDGNWEIYVMDADGSGVTRLTDNPAADFLPSWSPRR